MDEEPAQAPPADDPTHTPEQDHGQPQLRNQATAATFYGYTPFPPLMTLYTDFSGAPFRHVQLCGGGRDRPLYIIDVHPGYTPRGPLHFRRGLYLRNGSTTKAPILAAAGDKARLPLNAIFSRFSLESVILLPPVDADEAKNPTRDLVTEVKRASTTSTAAAAAANGMLGSTRRIVTFHFAIEVGVKMREREEFEWVDARGLSSSNSENDPSSSAANSGTTKRARFVLLRCPRPSRPATSRSRVSESPSSSSSDKTAADNSPDHGSVLAELVFTNVMSWNRLFSLELKGAGRTGELGDRWALVVVMTALRICWLRQYGKTTKGIVRMAEMVRVDDWDL